MVEIQVDRLAKLLKERGARTVGLQFPEGLKRIAYGVAKKLEAEGFSPIVSGNACYGACDIDTELLSMVDLLIHFGHSPLCRMERVVYEPLFIDFDQALLARAIPVLKGNRVRLTTLAQHAHMVERMVRYLESKGLEVSVHEGGGRTPYPGQVLGCSFRAAKGAADEELLFVGSGRFHPAGIALATGRRVIALDPLAGEVQEVEGERLLRRRFAMIETARRAERIGIILSTKVGQRRVGLAQRLLQLSRKAVLVAMNEVTPEELLNLGMECYVNTACPRLAYDDSSRFPAPLLTPQEFEIVVGQRSWQEYSIDELF